MRADAGRRAAAYWFEDGLPEIVVGAACLFFGGAGLGLYLLNAKWLVLVALVPFLFVWIWNRRIIELLKSRLTYPRTGYVKSPGDLKPARDQWPWPSVTASADRPVAESNVTGFPTRLLSALSLGGMLGSYLHWVVEDDRWISWSLPAGMAAAGVLVFFANIKQQPRYSMGWLVVLGFSGLPFHWITLSVFAQVLVAYVLGGVWLLLRGFAARHQYLHANPALAAQEVSPQ